ncbi:MAG TPA: hypothetical protein VNT79_02365 [Phycisphaerae bacterium]|nr:hypothetical protein [Phycisphaerae bacterium]
MILCAWNEGRNLAAVFATLAGATYAQAAMFRQYTRETPGRPLWALAAMVLAFAGTIGLAQWTVGVRRLAPRQALPDWPIVFTLPDTFHWIRAEGALIKGDRRSKLHAVYLGRHPDHGDCILAVHCDPEGGAADASELLGRGLRAIVGLEEVIQIGPLHGSLITLTDDGERELQAEAVSPEGLRISLVLMGEASLNTMKSTMKRVCESVEIVDP